MKSGWLETTVTIDSVDSRGNPILLKNVPAVKYKDTEKIRVDPFAVSRAEIKYYTDEKGLLERDAALLFLICAKPGVFKEGEIHYKYHLNKMLFYYWKNLEKRHLGEAFPHDDFKKEKRGPVPLHIDEDLKRLQEEGLVELSYHQWGQSEKQSSLKIELTEKGIAVTKEIWSSVEDIFYLEAIETKELIFPLSPNTIKEKVHREFPEYQLIYMEEDLD